MQINKEVAQGNVGSQGTRSRWLKRRTSQPPLSRLQPILALRGFRANKRKGCWDQSAHGQLSTSLRRGSLHIGKPHPYNPRHQHVISPLRLEDTELFHDAPNTREFNTQKLSVVGTEQKPKDGRIEWSTQISNESSTTTQLSSCQLDLFLSQDLSFISHPRPAIDPTTANASESPYTSGTGIGRHRDRRWSPLGSKAGPIYDAGKEFITNQYTHLASGNKALHFYSRGQQPRIQRRFEKQANTQANKLKNKQEQKCVLHLNAAAHRRLAEAARNRLFLGNLSYLGHTDSNPRMAKFQWNKCSSIAKCKAEVQRVTDSARVQHCSSFERMKAQQETTDNVYSESAFRPAGVQRSPTLIRPYPHRAHSIDMKCI